MAEKAAWTRTVLGVMKVGLCHTSGRAGAEGSTSCACLHLLFQITDLPCSLSLLL